MAFWLGSGLHPVKPGHQAIASQYLWPGLAWPELARLGLACWPEAGPSTSLHAADPSRTQRVHIRAGWNHRGPAGRVTIGDLSLPIWPSLAALVSSCILCRRLGAEVSMKHEVWSMLPMLIIFSCWRLAANLCVSTPPCRVPCHRIEPVDGSQCSSS